MVVNAYTGLTKGQDKVDLEQKQLGSLLTKTKKVILKISMRQNDRGQAWATRLSSKSVQKLEDIL